MSWDIYKNLNLDWGFSVLVNTLGLNQTPLLELSDPLFYSKLLEPTVLELIRTSKLRVKELLELLLKIFAKHEVRVSSSNYPNLLELWILRYVKSSSKVRVQANYLSRTSRALVQSNFLMFYSIELLELELELIELIELLKHFFNRTSRTNRTCSNSSQIYENLQKFE